MTLPEGHDSVLDHRKYIHEVLSESKKKAISYDQCRYFNLACTVTLTCEI